ncbi:thioredoxin family protein [Staphylococcus hyicus]|uniref:Thioredoxin n=1 Tax=Staphylococcus hyicus TaxID=1284 RepID=A0A0A8HUP6_STAHY|nr:thioredoxin family protein [Staphylococcus hyicus]AJC96674.1 thioredoxin [Staphylococcus hyicus]MCE5153446.1 thioredoxin family protein [Staphylococcus hyicus]MCQ9290180.1 thioredoxin family protein [Staphylococcus hyicus]MCQ9300493.1 thioredoxin family protein [Staphylococcus hyicus]MCQ9305421.1 thioredoxin family protein [Staphylococcus hyicus]
MSVLEQSNNTFNEQEQDIKLIFGYTPMCGTCKVSERMLHIANSVTQLPLEKRDLNYYPEFSQMFEIQSVPILLIMHNDKEVDRIYAFQSVTFLLERLKKVIDEIRG